MASPYTEPFSMDTLVNNNSNNNRLRRQSNGSSSSLHGTAAVSTAAARSSSTASSVDNGYNLLMADSEYEELPPAASASSNTATTSGSRTNNNSSNDYNKLSRRGRVTSWESNHSDDVFVEFEALEISKRNCPSSSSSSSSASTAAKAAAPMAYDRLQQTPSSSSKQLSVLSLAGWFHGNISREEAEHRLGNWGATNGLFLVREKTVDQEYAISFCENGRVEHRLLRRAVRTTGELGSHWILNEMRLQDCTSIESVIALCMSMSASDPLKNFPRLTQPCLKTK